MRAIVPPGKLRVHEWMNSRSGRGSCRERHCLRSSAAPRDEEDDSERNGDANPPHARDFTRQPVANAERREFVARPAARLVLLERADDDRRSVRGCREAVDLRCVMVAGPAQRWQTACSLSTSSARQSSSGIGPNGEPRKSWSRPGARGRASPWGPAHRGWAPM